MPAHDAASTLIGTLASRDACVGVVGLGYVGLPLAHALHAGGYRVVGFDIDHSKVEAIRAQQPYLKHLGSAMVQELGSSARFTPTSTPSDLAACDAVCICVPTPLVPGGLEPDLSYVRSSTQMVADVLRARAVVKPVCVSLESTTYPGTTRELCLPILERAGLKLGESLFLVFSPEREDPGRHGLSTATIPRLVGGVDDASTRVAHALYSRAVQRVIAVRSADVAEAAKLLENIYRAVNIALVNELKPVLETMGINIWEVIDAASTKPFGFQRFDPGPGLGGHCIPIDPFYLTWRARQFGHATRFIELAGEVNHAMPEYVVDRTAGALRQMGKSLQGARVLVLGIAYKPDVDDIRETPAAPIIELLQERGAEVSYHDPHVPVFPAMRRHAIDLASTALTPAALRACDAAVVVTHHKAIDWALVAEHAGLVIDTRNVMAQVAAPKARIVRA